jgi:hypothetical protein
MNTSMKQEYSEAFEVKVSNALGGAPNIGLCDKD